MMRDRSRCKSHYAMSPRRYFLGSQRDPSASPKMGPDRRSISIDTETAQKNFVRFFLSNQHRKILTARRSAFGAEDKKKPSQINDLAGFGTIEWE